MSASLAALSSCPQGRTQLGSWRSRANSSLTVQRNGLAAFIKSCSRSQYFLLALYGFQGGLSQKMLEALAMYGSQPQKLELTETQVG